MVHFYTFLLSGPDYFLSFLGKLDDIIVRFECNQVNIRLYVSIQTYIYPLTFQMVCYHRVVSKKTSPKTIIVIKNRCKE